MRGRYSDVGLIFSCNEERLVGVLCKPEKPASRGVVVVVGGPQYRAGSHRQFTLLAWHLAEHGIATLRFDYRGMGDSSGAVRTFEQIDADIRAAIDAFVQAVPEIQEVMLWGLCDAASAISFYSATDPRVRGLVLCNPWVRTPQIEAKAYLRHYYLARVADIAWWRRVVCGEVKIVASFRSLLGMVWSALNRCALSSRSGNSETIRTRALPDRIAEGLARFGGPVLLILCERDLTAQEFVTMSNASPQWRSLLSQPRVTRRCLAEANHTFSKKEWRNVIFNWTTEWLQAIPKSASHVNDSADSFRRAACVAETRT